jgi:uracil-DNA glycosylase family 4
VFGEGNPNAQLVFVGEGPGFDEDQSGRPFVGAAGGLLTKIIVAMHLTREMVYIGNVVKCRPPGNRNPAPGEIHQCLPFLKRQLAAIRPRVICALGKVAAQTLLETDTPISRLRGQFHEAMGIAVMPTFHPAYLLRNPEKKRDVWSDVQQIMKMLEVSEPHAPSLLSRGCHATAITDHSFACGGICPFSRRPGRRRFFDRSTWSG